MSHSPDTTRWLSALPDDLPISEINIPGSHNAAAINTVRRTRWTCQDQTITDQLESGIRLLDIRLKPKRRRNTYYFITCHGHLGRFGANEFQSLRSALEECTTFLKTNPTETIIITLQIDDYRQVRSKNDPQILQTLEAYLNDLPKTHPPNIPTLSECRGKVFLINRINDNPALGVPLNIPDNTPGTILTATKDRRYEVYVQDQYKNLPTGHRETYKLNLVTKAFQHKRPGNILLNFASGTKPFGRLLDIHKGLAEHLAAQKHQPLGWFLLDYPADLPSLIIAANSKID